jgi:hypothetical protein
MWQRFASKVMRLKVHPGKLCLSLSGWEESETASIHTCLFENYNIRLIADNRPLKIGLPVASWQIAIGRSLEIFT